MHQWWSLGQYLSFVIGLDDGTSQQPTRLYRYVSTPLLLVQPEPDTPPKLAKQDSMPDLTYLSRSFFILSHDLGPDLVQSTYLGLHHGETLPFVGACFFTIMFTSV
jgi:hypothetical protein